MKRKIRRKSINRKIAKKRKQIISSYKRKSGRLRSVRLKCKYCKMEMKVRTTHLDLYTDKVRKNWTCGLCKKSRGKDEKR